MKLLIAYSSKNGTTYKCAEMLKERLPDWVEVDIVNLRTYLPCPTPYDAVVVGGAVRMECLDKRVKRFLRNNRDTLSAMPCAVYICCGFSEHYDEYAETQLPRGLECSLGVHHFGGELKVDKVKGFEKLLVKIARESILTRELGNKETEHLSLPEILPENITLLAEKIKKLGAEK